MIHFIFFKSNIQFCEISNISLFFLSKSLLFSFFNRDQRAKPVIIDPALYSVNKSDLFWVTEKRNVPTAYKLFTGEKLGI